MLKWIPVGGLILGTCIGIWKGLEYARYNLRSYNAMKDLQVNSATAEKE